MEFRQAQFKADLAEVRKRLNENPGDAGALREAARYYLQEGYFKQAQQRYLQAVNFNPRLLPEVLLDYEKKIEKEPARMGLHLSLAGFLLAADSLDSTILELEEILEEHPQNVEAYNVLGRIYIKQEKIDDAIALLEKSIARGVKDVNLTETLAAAYFERGRIKEAVRFYEEILAQKPGDKHTLRILGELYTRLEDYLQAAQKYAAMFSDDPEVVREVIQRLEDLLRKIEGNIEIREILADIYMKTLDPDSAVGKLREIIRLESTKLEDAIQRLRVILRSYPNHPAAMLALAEALRRQGNYSEAVENYQQLIRIKPEFIEEAVRGYREVLEVCPEQVLARAYLGEAYLAQGKVLEALSEFSKMIEFDPSVAETVIRKCREVLRVQPTLMTAHIVLGQAYLRLARWWRIDPPGIVPGLFAQVPDLQDIDPTRILGFEAHRNFVRNVGGDSPDLPRFGKMGDRPFPPFHRLRHRAPEADDVAGLDLDDGLGLPREEEDQLQGAPDR